jgi:DNA (cytosine-5)-methyltransferase 1
MLTFGSIAAKYRPKWLVWENVPGVLSSNGGRDFGSFLGMLGQLGYGFAYRVLDAQYFGVAQRRRRVFVVGCLGDWRSAAAVLFERHSLQGHPAPSRQARQGIAGGVEIGPSGGSFTDLNPTLDTRAKDGPVRNQLAGAALMPVPHADISPALKARDGKGPSSDGDGDGDGAILVPMCAKHLPFDTTQLTSKANYSNPKAGDPCHPLAAQAHAPCIAFPERMSGTQHASTEDLAPSMGALNPSAVAYTTKLHNTTSNQAGKVYEEYSVSLDRSSPPPALLTAMQVRRLTPRECERLQGFPDNYTAIPGKRKNIRPEKLDRDYIKYLMRGGTMTFDECCRIAADGPRYKALGNSWAVPNVRWIGRRIDLVNAL